MGTKQSRRSISVRGETYARAQRLARTLAGESEPEPMSALVERLVNDWCARHGQPEVTSSEIKHYPAKRKPRRLPFYLREHIAAHFTW